MKDEILKILRMQEEGKITQEQAAELLAALADGTREKESRAATTEPAGASRPPSSSPPPPPARGHQAEAKGAFSNFVDAVTDASVQVGRAAGLWGGELWSMVHRDEGGNTVTLSKLAPPSTTANASAPPGDSYTFRGNTFNVSKVSDLRLVRADMSANTVSASKIARITVTDGRLSQCDIAGSSLDDVVIQGSAPIQANSAPGEGSTIPPVQTAGIRGVNFAGTKFSRARIIDGSLIDSGVIQAANVKDLTLSGGAQLRECRLSDGSFTTITIDRSNLRKANLERSAISALAVRESTWETVTVTECRVKESTCTGSTWKNTKFARGPIEGTTFDRCNFTDIEFVNCTFKGAALRNVDVAGLLIRNVDFSGKTIDGTEAFRAAAGV